MEASLENIKEKPTDFKICKECGAINYYENEKCINCRKIDFEERDKKVVELIERDYEFYQQEEGYQGEEIDKIFIDV